MSTHRARLGQIERDRVIPLIESLLGENWSGALRLRSGRRIGVAWLVNGQIAHALSIEGTVRIEGPPALEELADWTEGTYLLEPGSLPPARSIRESSLELLARIRSTPHSKEMPRAAEVETPAGPELEEVLRHLRQRVPEIQSLTVSAGGLVEMTTERDQETREWLNRQLKTFLGNAGDQPETLYVRQGEHTLLIVKTGQFATVLSAQSQTAPEALFWAGAEAGRQMTLLGDVRDSQGDE
ncbi:DUF4388 domain-containing protein [bacterium]|nr:DUF4388 domain-containing protein [bacterium]MBU1983847.1 DUF4388 domain-containing protein [bacterium]